MKRLWLTTALMANTGAVSWTASSFVETEKSITAAQDKIAVIENDSIYVMLQNQTQSLRHAVNENGEKILFKKTEQGEEIMAQNDPEYYTDKSAMERLEEMQQDVNEKTSVYREEIDTLTKKNAWPKAGIALLGLSEMALAFNLARTFSRNPFPRSKYNRRGW